MLTYIVSFLFSKLSQAMSTNVEPTKHRPEDSSQTSTRARDRSQVNLISFLQCMFLNIFAVLILESYSLPQLLVAGEGS